MIIYYLSILFSFLMFDSEPVLELEISEFRNTDGHVLISVFDNAQDYPDKAEKAILTKKVKVSKKKHVIRIEDLPEGEYAVVFLHDENDNKEMDTNFVGAPMEGYGASNDAVNTFSAPKYEEAKFQLTGENKTLKLNIFY